MKILHITPGYKPAYIYGGQIVAISSIAKTQVKPGHDVTVYTTTANGKEELDVKPATETIVDRVKLTYFNRITGDHPHVSSTLWWHLYQKLWPGHIKSWSVKTLTQLLHVEGFVFKEFRGCGRIPYYGREC